MLLGRHACRRDPPLRTHKIAHKHMNDFVRERDCQMKFVIMCTSGIISARGMRLNHSIQELGTTVVSNLPVKQWEVKMQIRTMARYKVAV